MLFLPLLTHGEAGIETTNMAESISPYALTTLQRVKDRIFDTNTGATQPSSFDSVLTRMINSCTDWFEQECGGRRFVLTLYANDIYTAYNHRQKKLVLRQAPVFFNTVTGTFTAGSTSVTGVSSTTGMVIGMPIASDNIQGTTTLNGDQVRNYITGISGSTITLAAAATRSETGGYLQVNGLIKLQWRAGQPATAPSWFTFLADQYELINNGKAGCVRLYGFIPHIRENMVRATYYAGYPVNWSNAGDNSTHLLPAEISNTVENLVVRAFKRRAIPGKSSESLAGSTVSWNKEIDDEDKAVIDHYRRAPTIF